MDLPFVLHRFMAEDPLHGIILTGHNAPPLPRVSQKKHRVKSRRSLSNGGKARR